MNDVAKSCNRTAGPHRVLFFAPTGQSRIVATVRRGAGLMAPRRQDALAAALDWPENWGEGSGLSGQEAALRDTLHRERLCEWLQARHASGQPCAWLRPASSAEGAPGGVLLSLNPSRPLAGLHGDQYATLRLHEAARRIEHGSGCGHDQSRASSDDPGWPPHPFAVAEAAARRASQGEDACICVLGESGAGKSEACKLVLLHLLQLPQNAAQVYHRAEAALAEGGAPAHRALGLALLLARSVLESFTHAAAPANANASRCVLATRLSLTAEGGLLAGAKLLPMLLQSGRAGNGPCSPGHGNFHVLHAAAASATPKEIGGLRPSQLRLLAPPGGGGEAVGAARGASFETLGGALRALGMEPAAVGRLRRLLLGLLLLGELPPSQLRDLDSVHRAFDRDGSGDMDRAELRNALQLLGVPVDGEQAARQLAQFDVDSSGRLDVAEFRSLAANLRRAAAPSAEVEADAEATVAGERSLASASRLARRCEALLGDAGGSACDVRQLVKASFIDGGDTHPAHGCGARRGARQRRVTGLCAACWGAHQLDQRRACDGGGAGRRPVCKRRGGRRRRARHCTLSATPPPGGPLLLLHRTVPWAAA